MTENDMRLHFMGEAQETTDDIIEIVESMCSMCIAADIDYGQFVVQIADVIVEYMEA